MNALEFDGHTRRFVLAGLAGGPLAALVGLREAMGKKKSKGKKKKGKKKKGPPCAGGFCPKKHRCEVGLCLRSCADPCPPGELNNTCFGDTPCFCGTTISGKTARLKSEANNYCHHHAPCSPTDPCPFGQVCATCACTEVTCLMRCHEPCPPG
jgi:hypothetical protein